MNIEVINISLDLILIAASVWMIFVIRGLGGLVGKAFSLLAWGAILLGIAHITETVLFALGVFSGMGPEQEAAVIELIHRLQVLLGFIFLVFGFTRISTAK